MHTTWTFSDIYRKDRAWKRYVAEKEAEAREVSEAELLLYSFFRFEATEYYLSGFEHLITNPVDRFIRAAYENVEIPTTGGLLLRGIFLPSPAAKGTLVALHGHSDNMYNTLASVEFLIDCGYQVLLFNARFWNYCHEPAAYSGYMKDHVDDVLAAVQYLKTRSDVDPRAIGLYGFSYGANKSIVAGSHSEDVKALVLDGCSMVSFFDEEDRRYHCPVTPNWYEVRGELLARITAKYGLTPEQLRLYDPYTRMSAIDKPVLLLHGMQDYAIKPDAPTRFCELAGGPKELITYPDAGHCDAVFTRHREEYIGQVVGFLDQYLAVDKGS